MKGYLLMVVTLFTVGLLNAQEWEVNFDKAKETASKENKNIVMVFQGSDWCFPCMKLERNIFHSEEFKAYAKDNYVMLRLDFPKRKKNALPEDQVAHNKKLAEKYNKGGYFPLVVVFDKEGNKLGQTGYKKITPKEYIKVLESIIEQ